MPLKNFYPKGLVMDPETLTRCTRAVSALCGTFGKQADSILFGAYAMGLEGLTGAQIETAAAVALRTLKFMPTPVELRELAGELPPKSRAVIAWEALSKAAARGYYDTVDFDDPVINAAVRNIGGWEYVTTIEDAREWEAFIRPRFEAAYVALYQHGISREQAAPLLGYHDRENAKDGYPKQEVKRIATTLPEASVRLYGDAPKHRVERASEGPKRIGEVIVQD